MSSWRSKPPISSPQLLLLSFLVITVLLTIVSLFTGLESPSTPEAIEVVPSTDALMPDVDSANDSDVPADKEPASTPLPLFDLPDSAEDLAALCKNASRRYQRPGLTPGIPVQYIHIPKAGGTTLQEEMQSWAKTHNVRVYLHDGDHEGKWRCSEGVQRGLLMGHRGFGFCQKMENMYGQRAFYIVAVREPISRFRSLFDYIMSNNFWFFKDYHRHWNGRALSDLVVEYNDTLYQGLPAHHPKMWGPIRFWSLARQQSSFMCGWDCVALEQNYTTHQVAERAIAHLQRTDAVVIMEKLDDLLDQLRFHLTWVPHGMKKFPYENKHSGRRSTLTERATVIVREWSKIDIELYELAKSRHAQLTELARRCGNLTSWS